MDNTQKAEIPHFSSPACSAANYHHRMHLPAPRTAQRDTERPNSTAYNSSTKYLATDSLKFRIDVLKISDR
jgi:hypothetical protein